MQPSENRKMRVDLKAIQTSQEIVEKVFAPYDTEPPNAKLIAALEAANFQGICYHCGSRQVSAASRDVKGRRRFICSDCRRYFIGDLTSQIYERLKNVKQVFEIQKSDNPNEALIEALKAANFQNICYYCGSRDFIIRKYEKNHQPERCQCRICRRTFTPSLTYAVYQRLIQLEPCPRCGSFNNIKGGHSGETGRQTFKCKDCGCNFVEGSNDPNQRNKRRYRIPASEDVWDAESLGLRVNQHETNSKLVFDQIHQDWLKAAVKKFIRYQATTRQYSTLQGYLVIFNRFSKFLQEHYPQVSFGGIDRSLILALIAELHKQGYSPFNKIKALSILNTFFKIGGVNDWFQVQPYLILKEDYPKDLKRQPRFIPEEVMQQLNQHLDALTPPVRRTVLVLQECC